MTTDGSSESVQVAKAGSVTVPFSTILMPTLSRVTVAEPLLGSLVTHDGRRAATPRVRMMRSPLGALMTPPRLAEDAGAAPRAMGTT
jgi:hypothetical protein